MPAFIAAIAALLVLGVAAALLPQKYSPIAKEAASRIQVDWARDGIVMTILTIAIAAYIVGFFVMLLLWGWHPTDKRASPVPGRAEALPARVAPVPSITSTECEVLVRREMRR